MSRSRGSRTEAISFNNLTVLKRALYYYGPQTVEELVQHVMFARPYGSTVQEVLEIYVYPALAKQKYFFQLPDGRWDIEWDQVQAQENRTAEKILCAENGPLPLPEIRKRVAEALAKQVDEVRIDLDSDPRFSPVGERAYALSAWHLVNDDAYELLSRDPGLYRSETDIMRSVVSTSRFVQETVVFAPKLDQRFRRGAGGLWGLTEWSPGRSGKTKGQGPEVGLPAPIEVSAEHQNRVDSHEQVFRAFALASRTPVHPRQLVETILGVAVGQTDYPQLVKAVRLHLEQHKDYIGVGPEQWRLRDQVPSMVWEPVSAPPAPRVRGSVDLAEWQEEDTKTFAESLTLSEKGSNRGATPRAWRVTLSFVHWRGGTLGVPSAKLPLFSSPGPLIELRVLLAGSIAHEHPIWFNRETQILHGFRKIYDVLALLPGSVFRLTPSAHRTDQMILNSIGEVNHKVQREQFRYMDPEALERRAREVGKPYRDLLIEVLQSSPAGLSFWEIFDLVSSLRPVSIATLRGLLSRLPCCIKSQAGTGIWCYDPSKPSVERRYRSVRLERRTVESLLRWDREAGGLSNAAVSSRENNLVRGEGLRQPAENSGNTADHWAVHRSHDKTRVTCRSADSELGFPAQDCLDGAILSIDVQDRVDSVDGYNTSEDRCTDAGGGLGSVEAVATVASGCRVTVRDGVSALLREGIVGDRELIREFLGRFHQVDIDSAFLDSELPAPETIRRSRQLISSTTDKTILVGEPKSIRERVIALLSADERNGDDRRLITRYYLTYHGVRISDRYLSPSVPCMETIRRTRQQLTATRPLPEELGEAEPNCGRSGGNDSDGYKRGNAARASPSRPGLAEPATPPTNSAKRELARRSQRSPRRRALGGWRSLLQWMLGLFRRDSSRT